MQKKFRKVLSFVLSVALLTPTLGMTASATSLSDVQTQLSTVSSNDTVSANDIALFSLEGIDTVFEHYITVDGTRLMDGGKELKFVSLNYPQATSDTAWEAANAVKTIKAMGGNVTRSYTIPVYNGQNTGKAYVTGVDAEGNLTFNEDALNSLDNLLAACNTYGIRLIIPLVDHWHWIGGMDGYVWLAGESDGNPSQSGFQSWAWNFYSSEKCMDYFKQMISHLLERENTVTGVKYKDDPAILCWETGNELGNRQQEEYDQILFDWTNEVVDHIKSIDQKHLVLDGRMSMSTLSLSAGNKADILGAHYYEGNYAERCEADTQKAHAAGKPFILGEFGAKVKAEPCIDVFQKGLENNTNGIMMWSLRAHKDGFGYYFHDEDGFWASYHWPGFVSGDYYGETEILRALYAYAQIANGRAANYEEAKAIPIPAPETDEAPLLYADGTYHNSFKDGSVGDIKWRGVVGGAWYEIQRADGVVTDATADQAEWTTIADEEDYVYDSGRNWEDKAHDCIAGYHDETAIDGQTYSYRLRACNESGVGLWSNIVTVNNAKHVVVDDLDLIAVSSTDANPTEIRRTYSSDHSANITYSSSSIVNQSATEGYIEYEAIIPVTDVVINAVAETEEGSEPKVFVSPDGINYTQLEVAHTAETTEYSVSNVSDTTDYYYTKIYMAGESKCKLDAVTITYVNDGASYRTDLGGAGVKTNVMIQDNTFGIGADPYYTVKSPTLAAAAGEYTGITTTDDNSASILYKTGDDINAYRIAAYVKDDKAPVVEYSYDGVSYHDVAEINSVDAGEYTKVTYGDLAVAEAVRVIRVTFPEGSQDSVILKSVELSSGIKSIPLAEVAPVNTLEDGEYYFGDDAQVAAEYDITQDGNAVVYANTFNPVDYAAYDCVYAWIKGDGTSNTFRLKLIDNAGKAWTSDAVSLSSTGGAMSKFIFGNTDVDFSAIASYEFIVSSASEVSTASGAVKLNGSNFYTGNYGVALIYNFDGTEKTIYVDSVYVGSSTKADDFEGYSGSNNLLNAAYSRNSGGGAFDMSLDSVNKSEGSYSARIDYDYNGKGYAGAVKHMDKLNLAGYDGFTLWIDSDGSGNQFKLQMTDSVTTYNYTGYLTGDGPMIYYLPFSDIVEADWTGGNRALDENVDLKTIEIYTNQEGSVTKGTFWIDDIKGANFVDDLGTSTTVTLDTLANGGEVTEFPYTITGTATYVDYVSLTIGEKVINIPVNDDDTWAYELTAESGVYNGSDLEVKAGFYYPNREVVNETGVSTLTINVAGNDAPIVESYDTVVWSWDFGANGTEGWNFDGFTPWAEADGSTGQTNLVAWTQESYNATFRYTINNIPNGVYTLSNDIKVKSNMNNVQVALGDGTSEVKSSAIDTADVMMDNQFLGKKFEVTNNEVTLTYYVSAPSDANGATFAVGDIKLYFVEGIELVENGDFTATTPHTDGWPNYPTAWDVVPYTSSGAVKTESSWFEADNNKVMVVTAGTAFELSQNITVSSGDAGIYKMSANIDTEHNEATVSDFVMKVVDANSNDVATKELANGKCELADIALAEGNYKVTISGTLDAGTVYFDDISLKMVRPAEVEAEETGKNYITNGDFEQVESEWPNLPTDWVASYTGGDGWSPIKGENGTFTGWASNPYTFALNQNVTKLPAGTYKLTAEVQLHNEDIINAFTMSAGDKVLDLSALVNATGMTKVTLGDIVVEDGRLSVEFAGDFKQSGAKIDNVALYLVEAKNYVVNGDFEQVESEWPNLPTDWVASYTGGDGWSPIKGENGTFTSWTSNPHTYTLSQEIAGLPAGIYSLSAEIKLHNADIINSFKMTAEGKELDLSELVSDADMTKVTLGEIEVTDGSVTIAFAGDFKQSGAKIDNVSFVCVEGLEQEEPEPEPVVVPTLAKVEIVENAAVVTWGAVDGATGYVVYRKAGNGELVRLATVDGAVVRYTDTALASNTTYVYAVQTVQDDRVSEISEGLSVTYMAAPVMASVENSFKGVTVKWNAVNGATGYVIYRRTGNGEYAKLATVTGEKTSSYTDATAANNATYTYAVQTVKNNVTSALSAGKGIVYMAAPTVSKVANTTTGVAVTWTKVSGATGYVIYRKTGTGSYVKLATITSGSTVTYVDKAAKNNTTYAYAVKAVKNSYISASSVGKSITYVAAPAFSSLTSKCGQTTLKWNQITGATGYKIYRKTGISSATLIATIKSGATVSYVDKAVSTGKKYTYTIVALKNSTISGQYTGKSVTVKDHEYVNKVTKATTKQDGSIKVTCKDCGKVSKTTKLYAAKNISLSKTSYTYTGKSIKPTVTVKDSKNKTISKSNYTVSYSNNKNVGKATVTITFKGNYRGTVTKSFTIKPASTSISKLTASSKGFTVKYKARKTQTSGYEIQYSTKSNFTGSTTKTVKITKNTTTSKTIGKLKAKQKYYVRVRTYKTVKINGKTQKIYSDWSKAKSVTTKK